MRLVRCPCHRALALVLALRPTPTAARLRRGARRRRARAACAAAGLRGRGRWTPAATPATCSARAGTSRSGCGCGAWTARVGDNGREFDVDSDWTDTLEVLDKVEFAHRRAPARGVVEVASHGGRGRLDARGRGGVRDGTRGVEGELSIWTAYAQLGYVIAGGRMGCTPCDPVWCLDAYAGARFYSASLEIAADRRRPRRRWTAATSGSTRSWACTSSSPPASGSSWPRPTSAASAWAATSPGRRLAAVGYRFSRGLRHLAGLEDPRRRSRGRRLHLRRAAQRPLPRVHLLLVIGGREPTFAQRVRTPHLPSGRSAAAIAVETTVLADVRHAGPGALRPLPPPHVRRIHVVVVMGLPHPVQRAGVRSNGPQGTQHAIRNVRRSSS